MTTVDGLLQAVIEEPERDDLRIVFADACEEAGDPDRSAFIRVQCRLAALLADASRACVTSFDCGGDGNCAACTRAALLRRRERELLAANWSDWSGRVATYCGNFHPDGSVGVTFRRGFAEEWACPLAWFVGGPCPACGGQGRVIVAPAALMGTQSKRFEQRCPDCGGSGTLPARGPALVRLAPVRTVRASDRGPQEYRKPLGDPAQVWWGWWRGMDMGDPRPWDLPGAVWDLVATAAGCRAMRSDQGDGWADFATEAAAVEALSLALLRWARGGVK